MKKKISCGRVIEFNPFEMKLLKQGCEELMMRVRAYNNNTSTKFYTPIIKSQMLSDFLLNIGLDKSKKYENELINRLRNNSESTWELLTEMSKK